MKKPWIKEALLYEKLENKKVRCNVCERRCTIGKGETGFCKTRKNIDGKLNTLVYGDISSISANPIEKKPLFHFWPGSAALTVGTWSCNFTCPWCVSPDTYVIKDEYDVEKIVSLDNNWKHKELLSYDASFKKIVKAKILKYFRINPAELGLKVYEIETDCGRKLVASEDHPIYTKKGIVPLKDLNIGDKVIIYPFYPFENSTNEEESTIVNRQDIEMVVDTYLPRSNKKFIISELRRKGLLPLKTSNIKVRTVARLLGFLFGDGYISLSKTQKRDKVYVSFCGKVEDLLKIKEDMKLLGFNTTGIIRRRKISKVYRYGSSHAINDFETHINCHSKTFCVLMISLGAPIGDKSIKPFRVPKWLFKAPKDVKREFLAAYFGSELSKPRVDRYGKTFFQPIFSINKSVEYSDNAIDFVKDLEKLLHDFQVKISSINYHERSVRKKDNIKTVTLYVLFSNEMDNLINLYGKIGYRYCKERETLSKYALEYSLFKRREIERIKKAYKLAISLKKKGLKLKDIYEKMQGNVSLANLVLWLTRRINLNKIKTSETFPGFDEWLKQRNKDLPEGLLWEKIVSKKEIKNITDLRDFTIEKHHNFFANGFLVSNCQNFEISKIPPDPEKANYISPEKFIEMVDKYRCQGTSISFNEPTLLFEWSLDVFRLAKERGFYNTFVTNGYMTVDALRMLINAGLDALNVDIKGCKDEVSRFCSANVEYVWRNCIEAKRLGAHVEITTLIVTGVNDDLECLRSIAQRIVRDLGENTPWHVTRYYPAYMYHAPPPKVEFLEEVRRIGLEEGLNYVYLGNVPGHPWENTYCPNCKELLIKRYIFDIVKYNLTEKNECPKCGEKIPIIGKYVKRSIIDKFKRFLT